MFITKRRAEIINEFYSDLKVSTFHDEPIVSFICDSTRRAKEFCTLAAAMISEKIGEVEDGTRNSLKSFCRRKSNVVDIYIYNDVEDKVEKQRKPIVIKTYISDLDENGNEIVQGFIDEVFWQNALDHIGCIIGVCRGQYIYSKTSTNPKEWNASVLCYQRLFHFTRNNSKYNERSLTVVEHLERIHHIHLHIHGQSYSDEICRCENVNSRVDLREFRSVVGRKTNWRIDTSYRLDEWDFLEAIDIAKAARAKKTKYQEESLDNQRKFNDKFIDCFHNSANAKRQSELVKEQRELDRYADYWEY